MGLIKTAAKTAVAVKTAHVVHDRIQRRQHTPYVPADVQQGHASPPHPAAAEPTPAAISYPDKLSSLERLGSLKSAGVLSDAEFEIEKARILHN
jgi:hypothetical protein